VAAPAQRLLLWRWKPKKKRPIRSSPQELDAVSGDNLSHVSSTKSRTPAFILIFAAVAGPTVAGLGIKNGTFQNPWHGILVSFLYEVAVFGFGFAAKIWSRLESRWVDSAADWLDRHLRSLLSHYEGRYMQHIVYAHRYFDVKGLTTQGAYALEMEQVFIELTVAPESPNATSSDLLERSDLTAVGWSRTIWDYLKEVPQDRGNLAILGSPGSGKTTLLKHVALRLALSRRKRPLKAVPILIFLRDHSETIKANRDVPLAQIVQDVLTKMECPAPPGWLERNLRLGKCIIMLDGLDEVGDSETRRIVVAWVDRQMVLNGNNRFLVTSRPFGYRDNPISSVSVLQVRPFNNAQVSLFVHNWYLANEVKSAQQNDPGVRLLARNGADDLLLRLRNMPALFDLAVNPLLLTMITTVHRYRSSLPGRRVELYSEICDVFLGKRQQAKGLNLELTPAQKKSVLVPLAYHMMCRNVRTVELGEAVQVISRPLRKVSPQNSEEDFLRLVEQSSGLLLEREMGVYGFAHLTIQEYLASVHVVANHLEEALIQRIGISWWHETIRLYAAQGDATSIISACLADHRPAIQLLALAIECLNEAREVEPSVRSHVLSILAQGVEDPEPDRRKAVAEALLALRLRKMVRIDEDVYLDDTLISSAEYQLFIDEHSPQMRYLQPDHWKTSTFPVGTGMLPIVGIRGSDAVEFCAWLSKRDPEGWEYELITEEELGLEAKIRKDERHYSSWCADVNGLVCPLLPDLHRNAVSDALTKGVKQFSASLVMPGKDVDDDLDYVVSEALKQSEGKRDILPGAAANELARRLDLAAGRALGLATLTNRNVESIFADVTERMLNCVRGSIRRVDLESDMTNAGRLAVDIDRAPFRNREQDHAHTRCLDFACGMFKLANSRQLDRTNGIADLLSSVGGAFFVLASLFLLGAEHNVRRVEEKQKHFISTCLELCVDSFIIAERMKGNVPAWEGIRITRTRARQRGVAKRSSAQKIYP
jgi:hypothetical protein